MLNGGPAANALALADHLSTSRRAGLGVLARRIGAGQVRDQVRRQGGAVGREVRPLRQVEIVDKDELVPVVAGQNEIGAGLLEVRAEEKLGVADFDMIGRRPFRQREPRYVRVIIVLGVKTAQHPEFLPSVLFLETDPHPKSRRKP